MNVALKQRIIGGFVLLALVAIFLPMLLNFSGERVVDRTSQIPPRPDIKPIEPKAAVRPENIIPAKPDNEIYQFGVESPEQGLSVEDEASGLNADGVPKAWLIQVGGFKDLAKADLLVKNLKSDGYKAFMQTGSSSSGQLHRVFVGPKIEKKAALKEKSAIDKKYQLESILVRFEP